jgi:hypothetical protein
MQLTTGRHVFNAVRLNNLLCLPRTRSAYNAGSNRCSRRCALATRPSSRACGNSLRNLRVIPASGLVWARTTQHTSIQVSEFCPRQLTFSNHRRNRYPVRHEEDGLAGPGKRQDRVWGLRRAGKGKAVQSSSADDQAMHEVLNACGQFTSSPLTDDRWY